MKKSFLAFALLITVASGFCQHAPVIVQNIVTGGDKNDALKAMDSTADKGLIIAATTVSTGDSIITRKVANAYTDALLIRYNQAGNRVWARCYGGSRNDVINDIRQTADGGFIAVGHSNSTNDDLAGNTDSLYYNIWIMKLSATGDIEWSRIFGGTNTDDAASVIQIADGSYVIAGYTGGPADMAGSVYGESDLLVIKLDANGINAVLKRYGGTRTDVAAKIIQLVNGNYAVIGTTSTPNDGIVTGNHSTAFLAEDIWVVWLDSNLNHLENRCYGSTNSHEKGVDILELNNGDLLIGASVPGSGGDIGSLPHHNGYEGWVARINKNVPRPYDTVWTHAYGGNSYDYFRSMVKAPDGNIIIGLQSTSTTDPITDITDSKVDQDGNIWLAKINPVNGAIIYSSGYGSSKADDLKQIILREEGLVFGGTLLSNIRDNDLSTAPAFGMGDVWIARLNNPAGITSRQQAVTGEVENIRSVDMRLKNNSMILNYTGSEKQTGVVQLLNIDGQLMRSYKVTLEKGRNSLALNTGILAPSAVYIGVLTTGNQKYSVKLAK